MELVVVEQVFETTQGDWVYRFRSNERGVMVRRVSKDNQLWSHGVLTQMFDQETNSFLPSHVCGFDVYFEHIDQAKAVVKAQA